MKIDAAALMTALDQRRHQLGELRSTGAGPLTWTEVAAQVGTHSATFSRLKAGRTPGEATYLRLASWLGAEPDVFCSDCESGCDAADGPCEDCQNGRGPDVTDPDGGSEAAGGDELAADPADDDPNDDPDGDDPDGDDPDGDPDEEPDADDDRADDDQTGEDAVAAIYGWGSLSDSDNEETQAKVARVAELLEEGAVGVSIMHDLDPDDMPSQEEIDALIEAEDWEGLDELFADIHARPRHVAIVDTPAFSDARLTLGDDGLSVEGPVTFEGTWTGDVRMLPYGVLVWDDDLLPIPIVIEHDGGTKDTVGYIDRLERQDGVTSALRPRPVSAEQVQGVAAAAGGDVASALPARYFERFSASKAESLHIDPPDAQGLRRVWGHAAPRGVCHRSDMGACFTYPGDVDKSLAGFHTGSPVALDDGTTLRPGALTMGGLHLDVSLAKHGVGVREANRHREDANEVFAMVRAWEDPHGLAISGVVMPDVDDATVLRALTLAPSVELWPAGRGRTLVGAHLVPTPAWPVAASAGGSAMQLSGTAPVVVESLQSMSSESSEDGEAPSEGDRLDRLEVVTESLARMEKALALLVADRLTDVPDADADATDADHSDVAQDAESANPVPV